MADTKYKIGVEITGDDSKFRASAKTSEKAVSDLEKKASGDFKKIASNFAGIFSDKAKDTGLGQFVGDVTNGTGALDKFLGPATLVSGAIVGISTAAIATGAGLFALAKEASDYGSEIADAQAKTGLTSESLSALRYQANLSGSDFGAMSGAISKFSKLVGEAGSGSKEAKAKLEALGIDPQEAMRDLDGAMSKAFKTINDAKPGVNQMTAAQTAFGKSGADLIPTIRGMNGDFAALKKRAAELGIVLSEEDVQAADAFGDTLDTLTMQAKAASSKFALQFAPEITGAMDDISKSLSNNKGDWKDWGSNIADVIRGIRLLATSENFNAVVDKLEYVMKLQRSIDPIAYAAYAGAKYLKQSGEESRAAEFNTALANSENVMPGMLDTSIGYAPPSAKNAEDEGFVKNLGRANAKKDKKIDKDLSVADILTAMRGGTMGQESGGNQFARNSRTGASGLFQVMPDNIPEWTKKTFGVSMTVEQFKKNAQAQIAVFNKYMGDYLKKGLAQAGGNWEEGVRRAAAAWYGGEDDMNNFDANFGGKGKEPTFREYTKSVLSRTKKRLGAKSGYDQPLLDGAIDVDKISDGEKAIADLNKQIALLGVTTEEGKAKIETTIGSLSKLTDKEKESYIAAAQKKDSLEAQAKATTEYNDHLIKLGEQFDQMIGVEKTATGELEKYIAALVASGKSIDPVIEANARNKALLIDMQGVNSKLNESIEGSIANYKAERDAVWDLALAHQELKNSIARETGGREETAGGIQTGIAAPTDDGSVAPKVKDQYGLGDFTEGILGGNGNNLARFQTEAEAMKAVYNDLENTAGAALGSMIEGGAQLLEQWIMTGEMSGEAIAQMTASIIAGVAAQAGVKAIFEVAEGLAAAANPLTAWQAPIHFAAAKTYGLVALGAAAVGMGIGAAGGLGGKKDKDSPNDSRNPSEYFSNNSDDRSMNYLRQSQSGNAQTERQNLMLGERINQFSQAVETFDKKVNSTKAGDVFVAGANQNRGIFAERTTQEIGRNSTAAGQMGRRLGLK